MTKKKKYIIGILAIACLLFAVLVYSVYSETRFDIPGAFGELSNFADKSVLAWAEAPALTELLSLAESGGGSRALAKDPVGKALSDGVFFREYIAAPIRDRVRLFARRLEQVTGLDIGEAVLARAFELPAALALYETGEGANAPVCILKVRTGDSIVASLAAKLGSALSGENGLTETKWKEKSIFSLGIEEKALHFALVNDVLVVSPEMDLLKLSIRSASLEGARTPPPDWEDFLARHPLRGGTLARLWAKRDFLLTVCPGLVLLIPDLARVPTLSLALVTSPSLALEASWNPPQQNPAAVLSESILRQLPASGLIMEANANFAAGESWLASNLFSKALEEMPKDIRANIESFLKTLTGDFALVFEGFDGNAKAAWPMLRLIFNAKASAEAFAKLEAALAGIPGVHIVSARHHDTEYRSLMKRRAQDEREAAAGSAESFNPCFARIGELVVLSLDEKSMKSAIELSRGMQAQFMDTALFTQTLGKARREGLTHYAFMDTKKTLAQAYTHMESYAFRSGDYSQRELAAAFRPLLNEGLGFTTLAGVAAPEEKYIRAALTPR